MRVWDLVLMIFSNLKRTKLRVLFCCLGMMIGTMGILLTGALGFGMEKGTTKTMLAMGELTEIIVFGETPAEFEAWIDPTRIQKRKKRIKLDQKFISEIEKWKEVENVNPSILVNGNIEIGRIKRQRNEDRRETYINIHNYLPGLKIKKGKELKKEEKGSIIIGAKIAEDIKRKLAKERKISKEEIDLINEKAVLKIRKNIEGSEEIKILKVKIVGLLTEGQGFEKDYNIYLPLNEVAELKKWQENDPNIFQKRGYEKLIVNVKSIDKVLEVQKELKEKGLDVYSNKEMIDQVKQGFLLIQLGLLGIGAIALIVASIGILNIMLISVYERIREIGIMKAVGASNKEIIRIFLGEGGIIGIIGGILGIGMSFLGMLIINFITKYSFLRQGVPEEEIVSVLFIPFWFIVFTLIFSFFIGLFASIYPALKAIKVDIVEAFRHE